MSMSWLKGWVGDHPPEKNESVMVTESLLMELDHQMKEAEQKADLEAKEKRRQSSGGVDYSWLSMVPRKPYDMPQLERLELEELCMKVKPMECGRVITQFRDALLREPGAPEMPRIMRAIINTILEGRPKDETIPGWISKSLTSLTKIRPTSSRKITPLNIPDDQDMEMQRSNEPSTASSVSMISGSSDTLQLFQRVDNLPV